MKISLNVINANIGDTGTRESSVRMFGWMEVDFIHFIIIIIIALKKRFIHLKRKSIFGCR